jgi:seryl-tRNA synthetase
MKKFWCLFMVFFLFTNYNYGQSKQDSIDSYEKVNKWAVVKLTIAYMEDLKGWPKKNNGSNKNQEEDTYDKLKTRYDLYSEDVNLKEINNLLLKGWSKTRDRVFKKYRKELADSMNANNFKNIRFVPEKVAKNKRSEAIATINEKYISLLPKQENKNTVVKQENISPNTVSNTGAIRNSNKSNLVNITIYLLLALAVLLILYLAYELTKAKNKINGIKKNRRNQTSESIDNNKAFNNKINSLHKEIDSLKSKIKLLEETNSDLMNQLNSNKNNLEIQETKKSMEDIKSISIDLTTPKVQQTITKRIYFPSPFENDRFANEEASETEKPISLYVAEIDKNTHRGRISLIETADLSRALNSPNTFLEMVCNYENAYSSSAKEIKVIEEGKVALVGEDWIVNPKIRIKFI